MRAIALAAFAALTGMIADSPGERVGSGHDSIVAAAHGSARALPRHDWPMLGRDATHNAVSPEKNVSLDFQFALKDEDGKSKQPSKNIAWVAELGSRTVIPPIISDGLVWIGTNARHPEDEKLASKLWDGGILLCFRESDGKLLWRNRTQRVQKGSWVEDFPQSSLGSVPYLDGDRLWFMNNRNEVVCFDIAPLKAGTGMPRLIGCLDTRKVLGVFAHKPLMSGGSSASIAGDADRLYVVTHNGVDESHINIPSPQAPSLICLDKRSGRLLWSDNSPGLNIMHVQIASPLACDVNGRKMVIVPQGDGWVRGFDAETGKVLWKCDMNPKDSTYELGGNGTRNYIVAAPVLYENRVYIPLGEDVEHFAGAGGLFCIDPTKDGDISPDVVTWPGKWKPNPNSAVVWRTPKDVPDDAPRIMVGKKKKRDLLRDRDFFVCRCFGSMTVHEGLAYAADIMGFVYCFDAKITGQPLVVDGKLFVGTWQGTVFAYAHGKEMKRLAQIEGGDVIRPGLVYANRTLYVTTDQTLYAIRTNQGGRP